MSKGGGGGVGSGLGINFLWYRFGRASLIERRISEIILIAENMLKFLSKLATISAIISHVASVFFFSGRVAKVSDR